jgi:hypothetical protein
VEISRRSRRNARSSAFASGITSNFELNADLLEVTYLSEWTTSACPVHIGGCNTISRLPVTRLLRLTSRSSVRGETG